MRSAPEYLKSLDVVGLSWLTRLCNIAWRLGTVPLEWQTGVVVPLFKKGDRRVCSNYRGITLLSLPGKVYAHVRVLERRIRPIVDPRIQEEQCGFCPGRGTLDQLYTLRRVLEGLWEFCPTSPHVLCGIWRRHSTVSLVVFCGECSSEYGVRGPLLRAVRSLYDRSRSLVRIAGSKSDLFPSACWTPAGLPFVTAPPNPEAMVLDRKRVACPLRVGGEVSCLKWRSSSISGSCSRVRERWSVRLTGGLVQRPHELCGCGWCTGTVVMVKKELSRKAKLS
ncbi:hypothetical protein L3Q82_009321 [Scortum barcoo]|uniref:Uncharacterized protein n=1 Tax=Scortum barcoo TaxID=214431 RepID=A0ACB8WF13_9TELE|nr:hypothetical protein L3Q82_009321 [Scortum barcoo]